MCYIISKQGEDIMNEKGFDMEKEGMYVHVPPVPDGELYYSDPLGQTRQLVRDLSGLLSPEHRQGIINHIMRGLQKVNQTVHEHKSEIIRRS
jgi:hypothetical protein